MSLTHHKNTEGAHKEKYFRLPALDIKNTRKQGTLALVEQNNRRPSTFLALSQIQHELKDPNKYLKRIDNEMNTYRKQSIELPDIDDTDDSFVANYIRAKQDLKKLPKILRGFNGKYFEEEQNGGKKRRSPKRSTKRRSTKKRSTKRRSTKKRSTKRRSTKKRSTKKRSTKRRSTKKRSTKKRSTKKRSKRRSTKKRSTKRRSTKKRVSKKRVSKGTKALKRSTRR
jgi:hypothetical protein